jgi:hypothetical protein
LLGEGIKGSKLVVRCDVSAGRDHAEGVTRSEEGHKDEQIPFRWRKTFRWRKKMSRLGIEKRKESGPRKRGRIWKIF